MSLYRLISTIGLAIISDLVFSGDGIDLSNRIGIIKTSKEKLKTLVSINKINRYKEKIKKNISAIIENAFYTLLINVMAYTSDKSVILKKTTKLYEGLFKAVTT